MPDDTAYQSLMWQGDPYPQFGPELRDYLDRQQLEGSRKPTTPSLGDTFRQKVLGPPATSPLQGLTPDQLGPLVRILKRRGMDDNDITNYFGNIQKTHEIDEGRKAATTLAGKAATTAGNIFAPNLTDMLTSPPPTSPLQAKGGTAYNPFPGQTKVPSEGPIDPRMPGALRDIGMLGAGGVAGRVAAPLAEGAAQTAGRAASGLSAAGKGLQYATGAATLTPSRAGAATPSTRPSFTDEENVRMKQLQSEIDALTKQQKADMASRGPKGADVVRQQYGDQIGPKQAEIERIRKSMAEQQAAYDKSTLPIAAREPDTLLNYRKAGLGAGLGTGAIGGLIKGRGPLPWLGSAALGGLEGAMGVLIPQGLDLGLPPGTPGQMEADKNLSFVTNPTKPGAWDYARSVVAPEFALGAGLGTIGHGIGYKARKGIGSLSEALGFGGKSPPQVPPPVIPPPPVGKWPSDPSKIEMYVDAGGKVRHKGSGKFVPKDLWNDTIVESLKKGK